MEKGRITDNTSAMNMIQILSEGKPPSMVVVMDLLRESIMIDPDNSALRGFGALYELDNCGIYGSRIEKLHKDVCGGYLTKTVACLRATQLVLLSPNDLNQAIDGKARLNVDHVMSMVKRELPAFVPDYEAAKPQANDTGTTVRKPAIQKRALAL
ncbi:MAG: hypothetical protein V1721_06075 [Pseudomonadota bacterium]